MDDKKQDNTQQPIVVYGMANIGCYQTGAKFQTIVISPEGQKPMGADAGEVFVPKQFRSVYRDGYELYIVVEIPYDQQQNYLASEDDDKNVCTDETQQADSEQLELPF